MSAKIYHASKGYKQYHIGMPIELKEKAEIEAKKCGMSLSQYCVVAIAKQTKTDLAKLYFSVGE